MAKADPLMSFQSTLPREGRRALISQYMLHKRFQSTPLCEGGEADIHHARERERGGYGNPSLPRAVMPVKIYALEGLPCLPGRDTSVDVTIPFFTRWSR